MMAGPQTPATQAAIRVAKESAVAPRGFGVKKVHQHGTIDGHPRISRLSRKAVSLIHNRCFIRSCATL
jgi:hypothetical protein